MYHCCVVRATLSPVPAASPSEEAAKQQPSLKKKRWQPSWMSDVKDPLLSTDDYIWNQKWQSFLDTPPSHHPSPLPDSQTKQPELGFLSLSRAFSLDRMDVDLSKELAKPSDSVLAMQVEAARQGLSTDEAIKKDKPMWRMAPTRLEQKQWEKANRATQNMAVVIDSRGMAAKSNEQYEQLNTNLQLLTLALGGLGTATAYILYSPEVATSYGLGMIGSLTYIRMLGNSVESLGKQGAEGAIRGAVGQPRLLVPVLLVMFSNRWNELLVPQYGFVHLQLIPILVGFLTYKVATIMEFFRESFFTDSQKF